MSEEGETLVAAWMVRAGIRKAFFAVQWVALSGLYNEIEGHYPTPEEFAKKWRKSTATAYRWKRSFAECESKLTTEGVWTLIDPRGVKTPADAMAKVMNQRVVVASYGQRSTQRTHGGATARLGVESPAEARRSRGDRRGSPANQEEAAAAK